ncbi:MAG: DUF4062 domain-containing protein [Jiangellaceae bacterium]|nr:DUF4062 domain-containing protein [Jiangellaceae bacterium]
MTAIRTPDQRVRVFISSTMKELAAERAAAKAAIDGLRLTPVLFELGARPYPPRELYLAYLEQSDVFVGIYGQQYGWVAPGQQVSGLEDEYRAASGKPKLVYVQSPAPERDPRLSEMLQGIQSDGLSYRTYAGADELRSLVADDLAVLLSERFEATASAPSQAWARRWTLPLPASRFVGRDQDIHELRGLITDDTVRLVTVVGPGGIGKTRLALQVAAVAQPDFDGAAFAALEHISAAELVAPAIASALGVAETSAGQLVDVVAQHLDSQQTLLVLDNFEHVIDGTSVLSQLLDRTRNVTFLVTSRERLRLTGERVFTVEPLAMPSDHASVDATRQSDAVQLFLDRAVAAGARLRLDEQELEAIGQICRRLDSLPLAIELAAARASVLGPVELLRRLGRGLSILAGGLRDRPARHQTLDATIRWSYDLLDDSEKRLFERLSVFAAGLALDAAESVCTDDAVRDVLDGLALLVDKSLVRADDPLHGQPRFSMLRVVREFAAQQLASTGESERLRDAHAEYYEQLALSDTENVRRGQGKEVAERHLADQDNYRVTVARLFDVGAPARVARLGLALWPVWWIRSLFSEGIEAMQRVLVDEHSITEPDRAHARLVLGLLTFGKGDYDQAAPSLRRAMKLYAGSDDRRGVATAKIPLGVIAAATSDNGDDLLQSAVDEFRALDDTWWLTFALFSLGGARVLHKRHADAVAPLTQSVMLARTIHTDVLLSNALTNLGQAYLALGNTSAAEEALEEALVAGVMIDNRESVARALEALAAAATARDDAGRGATLFGAAEGVRRSIGAAVWRTDQASHEETGAWLRGRLAGPEYRAAAARGAALSAQQLLEIASLR